MAGFVASLETIDIELARSLNVNIHADLVLEETKSGSLLSFFRNLLKGADNEDIKNFDWKRILGGYLVKGKESFIRNTNQNKFDIEGFKADIRRLASESGASEFSTPLLDANIVQAVRQISEAKGHLIESDGASFLEDGHTHNINLSSKYTEGELREIGVKEILKSGPQPMIFAVKKPDFLGNSMWELKHGTKTVAASIKDKPWLDKFHNRQVTINPGDSLRCLVEVTSFYDTNGLLKDEEFDILKVIDVIGYRDDQTNLV